MVTFDWGFPQIRVFNSGVGTYTNYVKSVSAVREAYYTIGTETFLGDEVVYFEVPDPTPETYVNFNDLTKDILVGWTSSYVGLSTIEIMSQEAEDIAINQYNLSNSIIKTDFA